MRVRSRGAGLCDTMDESIDSNRNEPPGDLPKGVKYC